MIKFILNVVPYSFKLANNNNTITCSAELIAYCLLPFVYRLKYLLNCEKVRFCLQRTIHRYTVHCLYTQCMPASTTSIGVWCAHTSVPYIELSSIRFKCNKIQNWKQKEQKQRKNTHIAAYKYSVEWERKNHTIECV